MIDEWEINSWMRSAKDSVARAIQAGEAGRAITLLDLVSRLERELAKSKKPAPQELPMVGITQVSSEEEEEVPF